MKQWKLNKILWCTDKGHVMIGTCLHLWKQNTQCTTCKSDFPGEPCFALRLSSVQISHHWRSALLLAAAAMEENRFIFEPVKSYANSNARTCTNICTAQADVLYTYLKKHKKTQTDREWLLLSLINFWSVSQRFSSVFVGCAPTRVRLHIHPPRLTYLSSVSWFSRRC